MFACGAFSLDRLPARRRLAPAVRSGRDALGTDAPDADRRRGLSLVGQAVLLAEGVRARPRSPRAAPRPPLPAAPGARDRGAAGGTDGRPARRAVHVPGGVRFRRAAVPARLPAAADRAGRRRGPGGRPDLGRPRRCARRGAVLPGTARQREPAGRTGLRSDDAELAAVSGRGAVRRAAGARAGAPAAAVRSRIGSRHRHGRPCFRMGLVAVRDAPAVERRPAAGGHLLRRRRRRRRWDRRRAAGAGPARRAAAAGGCASRDRACHRGRAARSSPPACTPTCPPAHAPTWSCTPYAGATPRRPTPRCASAAVAHRRRRLGDGHRLAGRRPPRRPAPARGARESSGQTRRSPCTARGSRWSGCTPAAPCWARPSTCPPTLPSRRAEIPAAPHFSRPLQRDTEVLQRERDFDVPTWLWGGATVLVLALYLSLLAVLSWGVGRIGDRAQRRRAERRVRATHGRRTRPPSQPVCGETIPLSV